MSSKYVCDPEAVSTGRVVLCASHMMILQDGGSKEKFAEGMLHFASHLLGGQCFDCQGMIVLLLQATSELLNGNVAKIAFLREVRSAGKQACMDSIGFPMDVMASATSNEAASFLAKQVLLWRPNSCYSASCQKHLHKYEMCQALAGLGHTAE